MTTDIKYKFTANNNSAKKRIRQAETRIKSNKLYAQTIRNAIKALRNTNDKKAVEELYPKVSSLLDRLAKRNVIHKNKAGNLKSKLAVHVNGLQQQ